VFETVREALISWGQQSDFNLLMLIIFVSFYGGIMGLMGYACIENFSVFKLPIAVFGLTQFPILFTFTSVDKDLDLLFFCLPLGISLFILVTCFVIICWFYRMVKAYKKKPKIYREFLAKLSVWQRIRYFVLFLYHDGEFPLIYEGRRTTIAYWPKEE